STAESDVMAVISYMHYFGCPRIQEDVLGSFVDCSSHGKQAALTQRKIPGRIEPFPPAVLFNIIANNCKLRLGKNSVDFLKFVFGSFPEFVVNWYTRLIHHSDELLRLR